MHSSTCHQHVRGKHIVACMGEKWGRRVPATHGGHSVKLGTELLLRLSCSLWSRWILWMCLRLCLTGAILMRWACMLVPCVLPNVCFGVCGGMMVYWRLVLNGVACCERSRQQPGECVCGPRRSGMPVGWHHHARTVLSLSLWYRC